MSQEKFGDLFLTPASMCWQLINGLQLEICALYLSTEISIKYPAASPQMCHLGGNHFETRFEFHRTYFYANRPWTE